MKSKPVVFLICFILSLVALIGTIVVIIKLIPHEWKMFSALIFLCITIISCAYFFIEFIIRVSNKIDPNYWDQEDNYYEDSPFNSKNQY
jgi:hypothetical protein